MTIHAHVDGCALVASRLDEIEACTEPALGGGADRDHDDTDAAQLRIARAAAGEPVEVELLLSRREGVEGVADQDAVAAEGKLLRVQAVGEDRRSASRLRGPVQESWCRCGGHRRPRQTGDCHAGE